MKRFGWTPKSIAKAKALRQSGMTLEAIGKRLGCSKQSVVRGLTPFGMNRRVVQWKPEKNVVREPWTRAEFDQMKAMRKAGAAYDDIALALNRTGQSVRSKIREPVFVPPKSAVTRSKGWPLVSQDLAANDDRYVAKLIEAAKLEGCYGPLSTGREVSVTHQPIARNASGTRGTVAA